MPSAAFKLTHRRRIFSVHQSNQRHNSCRDSDLGISTFSQDFNLHDAYFLGDSPKISGMDGSLNYGCFAPQAGHSALPCRNDLNAN
jgi:hypothetical protein